MNPGKADLAKLVRALEHALPNTSGAALRREMVEALEMGRRMLAEPPCPCRGDA
jgi:thiazole synthase ThiGH ThiG subunit